MNEPEVYIRAGEPNPVSTNIMAGPGVPAMMGACKAHLEIVQILPFG
jgi:hypothetical protein